MKKIPDTMQLGDHTVATAHGYCVPDCPACLRNDRFEKMFLWFMGALLVLGLLCGRCP